MPLLPYFNNMWYGAGSGAMGDSAPTIETSADIKGLIAPSMTVQGFIEPYLKGTMGRKQTLVVEAIGELHQANWKKLGRAALSVSIGASPSAFDIAQAVWLQVATAVDVAGTTGSKLNSAGSSGDPWTSPKALTVGKFIALK
jgi:hypothetical protein